MSQELGVLAIFDSGKSSEPQSFSLLLLKWLLLLPRLATLGLLGLSFVVTSALSFLAVLLAAKYPRDRFQWSRRLPGWTWRVGFCSLEEFIYRNWQSIDWNAELELYKSAKHGGRRFPVGPWTVDFLAHDTTTNDLVVIHLKRRTSSDTAVGQVLRHISWIKENVADPDQSVRGLLIAKASDASLEYAVKDISFVEIKTYSVDFHLALQQVKILTHSKSAKEAGKHEQAKPGKDTQPSSKILAS
jgi:hypothetical protein